MDCVVVHCPRNLYPTSSLGSLIQPITDMNTTEPTQPTQQQNSKKRTATDPPEAPQSPHPSPHPPLANLVRELDEIAEITSYRDARTHTANECSYIRSDGRISGARVRTDNRAAVGSLWLLGWARTARRICKRTPPKRGVGVSFCFSAP